ncbi:MAG TPA: NADP-dependent oxidoreductase [Ktedonobacteraceae bacterium]|nr:NADP-dependent oxidoreductase [Ktedonobacteraceae bacterium]
MKAIRIHGRGGPDHLVYEDAPQPSPGPGEVLVRVYATGVIATELTWVPTYETKAGKVRELPIPGHDLSGVVEEVGLGVTTLSKGLEVYGLTAFDRDGAEADYTIALPGELAPKPRTLTHMQAAAVPLSALTAWQALFEHADLTAGQTVLIHGAAGGVGVFAVQLARWAGAHVIATASAHNRDFLRELGANEIIDYSTTRFENVVHEVDLVFDLVGGDTLQRSWQVIKPGGTLVSVVSPRPSFAEAKTHDVRPVWFVVEPNREQLIQIGTLIDGGRIRPIIDTVLPLSQARQAYEQGARGHRRGKVVLFAAQASGPS